MSTVIFCSVGDEVGPGDTKEAVGVGLRGGGGVAGAPG